MTPQEKTIDLIKKLLVKANDESTTQAEAATFAAKAAELAAREQLNLSELDWSKRLEDEPIGRHHFSPHDFGYKHTSSRSKWQENLLHYLTSHCQCRFLLGGGNSYTLIGRESNTQVAAYLAGFLIRFAIEMSKRDYRVDRRSYKKQGIKQPGGFRNSWYRGFVTEVARRFHDMDKDLQQEFSTSTALIRLKNQLIEADDYLSQLPGLRTAKNLRDRKGFNLAGTRAGSQAGSNVNLSSTASVDETDLGGGSKETFSLSDHEELFGPIIPAQIGG